MPARHEVIIAGLGAMGSAAAFHLARAGRRVLGLDRFAPPHDRGSSHGRTRIIREAYFEHPTYVPLVQRAYTLWAELEQASQSPLFQPTGGLMIGSPESVVFQGAKHSAESHHLPHEILSSAAVRRRFPALQPDDNMMAVWEPRAGILFPERCIAAHLSLAARAGAQIQCEEMITQWTPDGEGVRVQTTKGEYLADWLLLCSGSWLQTLLPGWKIPVQIERQVLYWFTPHGAAKHFAPEACPVHLWQFDEQHFFYGFPDLGDGVKVAAHHDGEWTMPDQVRRDVTPQEIDGMRRIVRRFLPQADGPLASSTVCLYTNTPDGHFWLDRHPQHPRVVIASPCSGHGFKFSSAIGEVLAHQVTRGHSDFDLRLFRTRW
jgi:sarcosine oxidase